MNQITNYSPNNNDHQSVIMKQIFLTGKTGARIGRTFKSYEQFGTSNPIFWANLASGVCSGTALVVVSSCHIARGKNLNFLIYPLCLASSGLSTVSDVLDGRFSYTSTIL